MSDDMGSAESKRDALQRRLREARAKTSAFEAQARAKEEERELERKVRFEENKARDLPHIQTAEDEHGEIRWHNTPMGAIVLRKPNHLVFNKFMRKAGSQKGLTEMDIWRLVKSCAVYPDIARVEEMVEEYPGVTAILGNLAVELGQGNADEVEGK